MSRVVIASIVVAVLLLAGRRSPRHRRLALRDHPAIRALRTTRTCATVFIPGARDLDDAQTIAGLALHASRAARDPAGTAAAVVLASHPLKLIAARDCAHDRARGAGDALFASSDPWGFAASAARHIRDERPGLCVAAGGFSGEALLIADAANTSGVELVWATADLAQAPALLLTTDAALVGEELYAAPAIVSDSHARLAMLCGLDACRTLAIAIITLLALANALAAITGSAALRAIVMAFTSVLRSSA